jgi:AcrR family transcriptional regulator
METGKAGEAKNGDGKSWAAKAGMSEMPEMGGEVGVRARLLLAAETLIAERGFEAVSARDITGYAGVNLAAINYHFGSKDALLLQIFRTRAAELNRERAALLRAAMAAPTPDARSILSALIEPPTLWINDERRTALRFLNRARSEGPLEVRQIIRTEVDHLRRFADALDQALPHLDREEILWRLHFALGVLHHNSAADFERLARMSDGLCKPDNREALLHRLLSFIAAGFGI